MREIKFRIWNKLLNKMYSGMNMFELTDCRDEQSWGCSYHEQQHIFLQYTGLKDKNGKEIYEGDIVRYKHRNKIDSPKIDIFSLFEVVYQEGRFLMLNSKKIQSKNFEMMMYRNIEIIGNIYENTELLGEKKC